jgi:hypothetical protein
MGEARWSGVTISCYYLPPVGARRILGIVLALLLLGSVAGGIWYSRQSLGQTAALSGSAATVRGLIGSEKEAYFADPRVLKALSRHGLTVHVDKAGSRTIAHSYDPKRYDFGFPSGAPAAAELKSAAKASETFDPFYTPIVFASWKPIADILIANGIVEQRGPVAYVTDLPKLLDLVDKHTRWRDLKHSEAFATSKAVLINSTDVRTSNSAAMYLALASYVLNNQSVVSSQQDVDAVLPKVTDLFLRQGFQESSSAGPFEDYLALGMGKTPLLVTYESQLVAFWLAHPDRKHDEMVMLYPIPTVYSKHVVVPFTSAGRRLGELLATDPELQSLAREYGFRTGGDLKGPEGWSSHGIVVPAALTDVVDPPSQEWLERMISTIEQKFQ